jgi:hypothetical protein
VGHESKSGMIRDMEGKGGMVQIRVKGVIESMNIIKVYYLHVWKCHNKPFT